MRDSPGPRQDVECDPLSAGEPPPAARGSTTSPRPPACRPATVSLVLRGVAGPSAATRERVLEAAAQLGYRPDRAASLLASRRSRLIGVVMDIANPFHAQLVEDVQEAAERQRLRPRPERRHPGPRRAAGGGDAAGLPLRGAGPHRPAGSRRAARRAGPPAPRGGGRPARAVRGRGRRPGRRRRGRRPGRRPPGRPRPPAHHLRRRRARRDPGAAPPRLPAGHARARPGRPDPGDQGRQHRGVRRRGGARRPRRRPDRRPRCSPSTTGRRWACSTRSSGPASTSPAPCRWSATTTARSPGSPTSTSRPSARTPRSSPSTPSPPSIERLDGGRTDHREVVVRPRVEVRGTTGPPPDRPA